MRRGRGSARDALSALDQVVASGSADAARPELAAVLDALADGDVSQVLVALSALLAGGWGPQQLATELIDDLRQVFLAALAPELCTVSGPSLERFRAVAEAMGLARVVRSMEILGHALVDMREAPDAQVVLEIAAVRAVRPDLDSGMEALSERVSVLERAQSGAPAFPRPGAPAERGAPPAPTAAGSALAAAATPRPRRAPPAGRGGAAALHRRRAAQQGSGRAAHRRQPTAADAQPPPPPPPRRLPPAADAVAERRGNRGRAGGGRRGSDPHPRSRQPHRGLGRRHPAVPAGAGQGSLRQRSLRRGGRAGRPLRAAQRRPPGPVRRTAGRRGGGLSDHFGTTVTLVLDIDDTAAPPAARSGPSPAASGRSPGSRAGAVPPRRWTTSRTSTPAS